MKRLFFVICCIAAVASCEKYPSGPHPDAPEELLTPEEKAYTTNLPPAPSYDGKRLVTVGGSVRYSFGYSGVGKVNDFQNNKEYFQLTYEPVTFTFGYKSGSYETSETLNIDGFHISKGANSFNYDAQTISGGVIERRVKSWSVCKYDEAGRLLRITSFIYRASESSSSATPLVTMDEQTIDFTWKDGRLMRIETTRSCDGVEGYAYHVVSDFAYDELIGNYYEMWDPALFANYSLANHFREVCGNREFYFLMGLFGKAGKFFPTSFTNNVKICHSGSRDVSTTTYLLGQKCNFDGYLISSKIALKPEKGEVLYSVLNYTYE